MSNAPHTATLSEAQPADTPSAGNCILIAEAQLAWFTELAEIAMALARNLKRRDEAETVAAENIETAKFEPNSPAGQPGRDPCDSFAKISRAIRLTCVLQAKTAAALRDLRAGVAAETLARDIKAAKQAEDDDKKRRDQRKRTVEGLVEHVMDVEAEDAEDYISLEDALNERLSDDPAYDNIDDLPLRDAVERICADLCLTPDWSRWTGEGWAPHPPWFRPPTSVYRLRRRRPFDLERLSKDETRKLKAEVAALE